MVPCKITLQYYRHCQLREQLPTALPTNAVHSEEEHSMYRLQSKHSDLASIWDQWFGEGIFADEYGGINGRNQLHGAKWRQHIDKTEYSRHNRLVKGVISCAASTNKQPQEIVGEWEPMFLSAGKSVGKLVNGLQKLGLLKVGAKRGKSASARANL
jgi:hypothetical protein